MCIYAQFLFLVQVVQKFGRFLKKGKERKLKMMFACTHTYSCNALMSCHANIWSRFMRIDSLRSGAYNLINMFYGCSFNHMHIVSRKLSPYVYAFHVTLAKALSHCNRPGLSGLLYWLVACFVALLNFHLVLFWLHALITGTPSLTYSHILAHVLL
uniref:Uncharacterized protein n=1 Tax=Opuntia streptacantha TaxID=393608 RepID=A0A7C8Z199_OPUST